MDGVIVSWSSRGGSGTVGTFGSLRVRVLRNTSGSTFRAVRSGPMTAVPMRATGDIITIQVNPGVPINVNDYVGIDVLGSSGALAQRTMASASFTYQGWQPPLADGVTAPPTFGPFNNVREMLYQATIEPDADHDGFGDETQDKCPGTQGQRKAVRSAPRRRPTPTATESRIRAIAVPTFPAERSTPTTTAASGRIGGSQRG